MSLGLDGYVADEPLRRLVAAALATKPVAGAFLAGPPGAGKTHLAECLAKALGVALLAQQATPGMREEDLVVRLVPDASQASGVRQAHGVLAEASIRSRQERLILLLDEWDKARPSADALLLDWLQSGRLRWADVDLSARQDNLIVLITLNDERDLSEPLLRRLPWIELRQPSVAVVRSILERTHRGHPYLPAALRLYSAGLRAALRKPVTVQELRQLLDALSTIGDWDTCVYTYVSKSRQDHQALVEALRRADQGVDEPDRAYCDPELVESAPEPEAQAPESWQPRLPRPWAVDVDAPAVQELPASTTLVVEATVEAYDSVVRLDPRPSDDPATVGDYRVVDWAGRRVIVSDRPWPLMAAAKDLPLWGQSGEVLLVSEQHLPLTAMLEITRECELRVTRVTRTELVAVSDGVQVRWTPDGVHVLADLQRARGAVGMLARAIASHAQREAAAAQSASASQSASPASPTPRRRPRPGAGTYRYPLGGGLPPALIVVEREGQQNPCNGDAVVVTASLCLPANRNNFLLGALCFDERLSILGQPLRYGWGGDQVSGYRRRSVERVAATWAAAESAAHTAALEELTKLRVALRQRRAALRAAEASDA